MVHAKAILCTECGESYSPNEKIFHCRKCDGSLDIVYDYEKTKNTIVKESFMREPPWHWKYWMFYPITNLSKIVSLQEGGTPLIKSRFFPKKDLEIWLKYEGTNPTGSFKDRGSTIEVTKALEFNVKRVCCASTGNMGASVAAYCGKAGIDCKIFLPKCAAGNKIKQIKAHGAELVRVDGDYTKALRQCEEYAKETNTYLMGDYPYRGEGEKSVGFEIADQMNWKVPDYIISPMGNGTLIYAIWDAFNELKKIGLTDKLPKMVGIQAEGCSPIVNTFKKRKGKVEPIKNPKTIATAIECGDPIDGRKALIALNDSRGMAETVDDREILKNVKVIAKKEGIFVEPSGAVSVVGMLKLKDMLRGTIVCILTGHGLKDPSNIKT